MEHKHTPGPWEVSEGNNGSIFGDLDNPKHDGDNPYIGVVAGFDRDEVSERSIANAALIESAPDLLKALEEVVRMSDRKHVAWDKAKEAIKKATATNETPPLPPSNNTTL